MGLFGVAVNPWEILDWEKATGIPIDLPMVFENWDKQRPLTEHFDKLVSLGRRSYAITWEPWSPPSMIVSGPQQGELQPDWSMESIALGRHDTYIKAFADAIRDSELEMVYIRFAHEMNGNWYPWHHDPSAYVNAWKRVHLKFRERNCLKVKWIWSPNANLYQNKAAWLSGILPYWPGERYVDYTGVTAISFGGMKNYSPRQFLDRLDLLRHIFDKAQFASEVNCAYEEREEWLRLLAAEISEFYSSRPAGLIWSQQPSRAGTLASGLNWSVTTDSLTKPLLRRVAESLH